MLVLLCKSSASLKQYTSQLRSVLRLARCEPGALAKTGHLVKGAWKRSPASSRFKSRATAQQASPRPSPPFSPCARRRSVGHADAGNAAHCMGQGRGWPRRHRGLLGCSLALLPALRGRGRPTEWPGALRGDRRHRGATLAPLPPSGSSWLARKATTMVACIELAQRKAHREPEQLWRRRVPVAGGRGAMHGTRARLPSPPGACASCRAAGFVEYACCTGEFPAGAPSSSRTPLIGMDSLS